MNLKKNPASNWKLYCIIDKSMSRHRHPVRVARFLFEKGADVVQLRYKNRPSYLLLRLAKKVQALAKKYDRALIINDRLDVALAAGSAGTHLGKGDMSIENARLLLGPNAILGKTAHSVREAGLAGRGKINYLSAGPVFFTPLKKHLEKRGIGFIKKIKKRVFCPVFAIGGINEKNANSVIRSGADGICVTRAASKAAGILRQIS